jgi:hypothetical protein
MSKKFQIRESRRFPFHAPVEIRWIAPDRQCHFVRGTSYDVSIYGLGLSVPRQVPADQELTVVLNGIEVCGGAVLRHSQPFESAFRIGLYFRLTLLMQNIPEVDDVLQGSDSLGSAIHSPVVPALLQRFAIRLWRIVIRKTNTTVPQTSSLSRTAPYRN